MQEDKVVVWRGLTESRRRKGKAGEKERYHTQLGTEFQRKQGRTLKTLPEKNTKEIEIEWNGKD